MTGSVPENVRRLAERLTGPAGPELSCEECFDVLDVYVERELAGTEAATEAGIVADADVRTEMPAMHAHLMGCSACRDDHDSLLELLRNGFGA